MSKEQTKPLKGGLDIALRVFTGTHASFISKNLSNYLVNSNIDINPFDLVWEDRHKLGSIIYGNRKLPYAVWEHTIPIREFRESLILSKNESEIRHKINQYPGVAWITRDEDAALTKKKFLSVRPNGFINCYLEAGITLLTREMYQNAKRIIREK